ncbi:MAG: transcriptional repressor [Pseudomonadota bacterium]
MTQTQSLIERIREAGGKVTTQRTAICTVLEQSDDHPHAEDVFQRAKLLDSTVSLSCVYRNLKYLVDQGLIDALDLGDSKHRYEVRRTTPHDHLIDLSTGDVVEFRDAELDALKRKVASRYGYRLKDHRLALFCYPKSATT